MKTKFFHEPKKITVLKIHEWFAIFFLSSVLIFLGLITGVAKVEEEDASELSSLSDSQRKIEIIVKGAVEYPGTYYLPYGTTLRSAMMIAQLLPHADVKKYNLDRPLKNGRIIEVSLRQMLEIYLTGAVNRDGSILIAKGSRLEDLIGVADLSANADTNVLRKKRKLKQHEIIHIPTKS